MTTGAIQEAKPKKMNGREGKVPPEPWNLAADPGFACTERVMA
jgi:hypothetical protein